MISRWIITAVVILRIQQVLVGVVLNNNTHVNVHIHVDAFITPVQVRVTLPAQGLQSLQRLQRLERLRGWQQQQQQQQQQQMPREIVHVKCSMVTPMAPSSCLEMIGTRTRSRSRTIISINNNNNSSINSSRKNSNRQSLPLSLLHLSKESDNEYESNDNDNTNIGINRVENSNKSKTMIQIETGKDKEEEKEKDELIDPIYILPIATTITIIIGICSLLYIKLTNPMTTFDIDFYMALDDTLKNANSSGMNGNGGSIGGSIGGGGVGADEYVESIVGLPPLSPAEKIVGALFGPPSSNKY